ncbi:type III-B CRISPR module RAMP protein Cmr6 [Haliangium ochraceum]|uniref:CRISPR-associated RAMP protein, Cmr6 family n=1 Tax=Haliangium ochraceum (strain DSM 14365 / JCM 11303 / SMP-2) TaxID=502025 RepID=D0LTH6_HALO1|nr:type III-B CRISPR module RAMP protein Cmr6 [Haliangium ochraceum]ACY13871.1 CRISPR-associated RAMP protein, Cmr6 family [Haliangium ochraceum DSM 14365]
MSADKELFLHADAARHPTTSRRSTDTHAGLWYDKYYRWPASENQSSVSKDRGQREWLQTLTTGDPIARADRLDEFAGRRERLAQFHGGRTLYARTTSRFVTGLGRAHPVENGFAWHHSLGTPYLPGSGIKGLVRAWAGRAQYSAEDIDALLGKAPGRNLAAEVGRVIFLDAVPTVPPQLEADVMTPHYGAYYQQTEAPGDWLSPVPIVFLVAAAGLEFQFPVLPSARNSATAASDDDLETVIDWMQHALRDVGAGAKTAVGYGRFADAWSGLRYPLWVKDLTERREAQRPPLERAIIAVQDMPEQEALTLVRVLSQGGSEHSDMEREHLRAALCQVYLEAWSQRGGMGNTGEKKRKLYLRWLRGET